MSVEIQGGIAMSSSTASSTPPQHVPFWKSALQFGMDTAIPFARAVEYGAGKEFVTGEHIDRKNVLEILRATTSVAASVTSGFAVGQAMRGATTLGAATRVVALWSALPLAVQGASASVPGNLLNRHISWGDHETRIEAPGPTVGHHGAPQPGSKPAGSDDGPQVF